MAPRTSITVSMLSVLFFTLFLAWNSEAAINTQRDRLLSHTVVETAKILAKLANQSIAMSTMSESSSLVFAINVMELTGAQVEKSVSSVIGRIDQALMLAAPEPHGKCNPMLSSDDLRAAGNTSHMGSFFDSVQALSVSVYGFHGESAHKPCGDVAGVGSVSFICGPILGSFQHTDELVGIDPHGRFWRARHSCTARHRRTRHPRSEWQLGSPDH